MSSWNWMEALQHRIHDLSPSQILLPGTHASGCFSRDMAPFARCQSVDIAAQLHGGVRALDIRVTREFAGLHMHLGGLSSPQQGLQQALLQVAEFVNRHPFELVVILLGAGDGSTLADECDKADVRRAVLDTLRGRMVPFDTLQLPTFGELWHRGRNVLVISRLGRGSGPDRRLFWPSSMVQQAPGAPRPHVACLRPQMLDALAAEVAQALRPRAAPFLWADCCLPTLDSLRWAASDVNLNVVNWLNQWAIDPATRNGLNVVSVDHVHSNDFIVVRTVLELYADGLLPVRAAERPAAPAGTGLRFPGAAQLAA